MPAETGAAVIGKNIFPENAGMGTGEHESAGTGAGDAYAGCTCVAFFLFVSGSETWQGI